jgi:TAG lipase/steryl ester hydrolase/phospholipase A2/LPA acyltransferase
MRRAESYQDWSAAAEELDQLEGNDRWRAEDASPLYDHALLRQHLDRLQQLRRDGRADLLIRALQESLYRHLGEISDPQLYQYAHSGTKQLIVDYLGEAERAMRFVAAADLAPLSPVEKLHGFQRAQHNFGRTALVLSGGLSFGIYHVGVVKALWQQRLLPRVISGSSMGSIVAATICSRSDAELDEFFDHPERVHLHALQLAKPLDVLRKRQLLDQSQLLAHIIANAGDLTFKEAFVRSRRVLNITVSPTRSRQKPRVLNHLTAPDVTIAHSALASCAMPPGYGPAKLFECRPDGCQVPYMGTERWIDGSLHGDVPALRLGRLHNVNHTIVSQANPHVVPFIRGRKSRGPLALTWQAAASIAQAQAAEILGTSRHLAGRLPLRPLLDRAHAVTKQSYLGDINIHFPFQPTLYRRVASNPDAEALKLFIRLGEQATWPQIPIIRDQTRIGRTFDELIPELTTR